MLWIIQKNLDSDNKRDLLLETLSRQGIDYLEVDVRHNTITPDIPLDNTQPIITNGSIMLSNIARSRGWISGSLINENFSYDIWAREYSDFILNKNAMLTTLQSSPQITEPSFIRPLLDNKSFNGRVFIPSEFEALKTDSVASKHHTPRPDTQILIAKPQKIGQEHRHYVMDGQIITSSRYKLSGQPNFAPGCDTAVTDVIEEAIKVWTPARAFVIDSYISGDDIGIVEIGGICHAGLYEANLMKLVNALDSMSANPSQKMKF